MNKELFIIVPDFNGSEQTKQCLKYIFDSEYKNVKLIIVDHGDDGKTWTLLKKDFPDCIRIEGSRDHWWTAASNLGIRHALKLGAQMVMLLNNDCFVEKDTIGTLVKLHQLNPESIIAPVQLAPGLVDVTSFNPSSDFLLGFPTLTGKKGRLNLSEYPDLFPVNLIIGGRGVIISAAVFNAIGLLDEEHLPHYGADHDFFIRARLAGIKLYTASQARVVIDDKNTTISKNIEGMTWNEFRRSLFIRRSHRNLSNIAVLFRRYYPIRCLYMLGIGCYYTRYFMLYVIKRSWYLIRF